MNGQRRPRLCILNLDGYPLYNPECSSIFGGAEVQCFLLAQGLAATAKFDVHVIVKDHGQHGVECKDGVQVHPHSGYRSPVRVDNTLKTASRWWARRARRALTLRLHLMHTDHIGDYPINLSQTAIYDEVNADAYLARWNTTKAADLAFYCTQRGKPFIFMAASNADYGPEYRFRPELRYVVEHAKLRIAQTRYQSNLLRANYGRSSVVIGSLIDLNRAFPRDAAAHTILWIGKSHAIKHPEAIVNLARELPEYRFILIMNCGEDAHSRKIQQAASAIENITLVEHVPYPQIERYFAAAKLFVNTSPDEGFPNTFLQAAKYGVPIVSYQVDPGEIISRHGAGLCCDGDFARLKENVRFLMENPARCAEIGDRGLLYVTSYHDRSKIISDYEQAITSVLTA